MKKLFLTISAIGLIFSVSFAQGRFSPGFEVAVPTGDLHDLADFGIGASARYEAPICKKLNWTATAEFIYFITKNIDGTSYWEYLVPIQGGIKYYFNDNFDGFYAGAEIGVHYIIYKDGFFETYKKSTDLSYAPSLGYHLKKLDISVRYQLVSDADYSISYVGFRIAYAFGGRK
jgi:hypothetical protein